jgi:glycosyltransferase involved in cell wall biosynthesis
MISIIIPAHNEENVIQRCLKPLIEGFDKKQLEIIIVCNGCTDGTAEVAQDVHPAIRVVTISTPSKIAALNEGDRLSSGFPRIYLDADIITDWPSISKVAEVLENGSCLAAAPKMIFNLEKRNLLIKSYYRLWSEVPYFKEEMIGSGFYALSREGRKRFDVFPTLTADDEFIRRLFTKKERKTVTDAWFQVTPPKTVSGLVKIKTRALFGILELEKISPKEIQKEKKDFKPFIRKIMTTPTLWFPFIVYSLMKVYILRAAKKRIRQSSKIWAWDRDDSAREN